MFKTEKTKRREMRLHDVCVVLDKRRKKFQESMQAFDKAMDRRKSRAKTS